MAAWQHGNKVVAKERPEAGIRAETKHPMEYVVPRIPFQSAMCAAAYQGPSYLIIESGNPELMGSCYY
jgi:hypothetical protein